MSKAAEMGKASFKGSFNMMWGLVVSTIISSVGTIIVARFLLSPEEMGLYTLAIAVPTLIAVFRDWGINSAIVKYTAQYNTDESRARIRRILKSGLIFEVTLGVALTVLSILLSGWFADLYAQPIAELIQIASFTILLNAFVTAATAAFTGFFHMEYNSIMLICQAVTKTVIVPPLVIIGLGVGGAILGYDLGLLVAGMIGLLFMWFLYRKLPQEIDATDGSLGTMKTMLRYGFPLSIAAILSTSMVQFYTVLTGAFKVPPDQIGNYGIAQTFVVLITFFAGPVTTVLFPAFSKLDPEKDHETLKNVYRFSVKYASLLVVPVAALVMALAQPGVSALFGDKYPYTPLYLSLLALSYLFTAFGALTAGNFINSQGKTKVNLELTILTVGIGFPLGFIFIQLFGILGLITATLVAGIPSLVVGLLWIKKHYDLTVDWSSSAKILFCSGIAAGASYVAVSQLTLNSWVLLVIGVVVFVPILALSFLLTRTVTRSDIENLRGMFGSLGSLSRILNHVLGFLERLMNILRL